MIWLARIVDCILGIFNNYLDMFFKELKMLSEELALFLKFYIYLNFSLNSLTLSTLISVIEMQLIIKISLHNLFLKKIFKYYPK